MGCGVHVSFALISSKVLVTDTDVGVGKNFITTTSVVTHCTMYVLDNDTPATEVSTLSLYRKNLQMENHHHSLALLLSCPIHDLLRNAKGITLDLHHYTTQCIVKIHS